MDGSTTVRIFGLHEVFQKNYPLHLDYMKYYFQKQLSSIFGLHEVYFQNNYPLYLDYMKYLQKNVSTMLCSLLRVETIVEVIECNKPDLSQLNW